MPDATATQSLRIQSFGTIVFVEPIPRGRIAYVSSETRVAVLPAAERVVEVPADPEA